MRSEKLEAEAHEDDKIFVESCRKQKGKLVRHCLGFGLIHLQMELEEKTQNETQPYFSSAYFPIAIARKTLLLGERDCHTIFALEFPRRSSW